MVPTPEEHSELPRARFVDTNPTILGLTCRELFAGADGGQSYFTHITPYGVWRDPSTPLFWTPSNFGGEGKGGNVTYPLSGKLLASDHW